MSRNLLLTLAATLLCFTADGYQSQNIPNETAKVAPVRNWGNWWPAGQFQTGDTVELDQLPTRTPDGPIVRYLPVDTPRGSRSCNLKQVKGIGLQVTFTWMVPAWEELKMPDLSDFSVSLVDPSGSPKKPKATPKEDMSVRLGVFQFSHSTTFDFTEQDLRDYWMRVETENKRSWYLIPYGLTSDPAKSIVGDKLESGIPKHPKYIGESDSVHLWNSVYFHIRDSHTEFTGVMIEVVNGRDPTARIHVTQRDGLDDEEWEITSFRSTAAYASLGGTARFGFWSSIEHDADASTRTDSYVFPDGVSKTRSWALLRCTIDEEVFDLTVPSSLVFAKHGWVTSD